MTSYKSNLDFTNLWAYQVISNLLSFWNPLVSIVSTAPICIQITPQSTPPASLTTSQTDWLTTWTTATTRWYLLAWISDTLKLNWQSNDSLICFKWFQGVYLNLKCQS